MDELVTVLQHAQSADGGVRSQAEARLQQFAQQNYAGYLIALAGVLASAQQAPEIRQLAGVVLKNSVQSTAEVKNVRSRLCLLFSQPRKSILIGEPPPQAELAQKWLATEQGAKAQIRQLLLATLPAEVGLHCTECKFLQKCTVLICL